MVAVYTLPLYLSVDWRQLLGYIWRGGAIFLVDWLLVNFQLLHLVRFGIRRGGSSSRALAHAPEQKEVRGHRGYAVRKPNRLWAHFS
jgi:hypothetical protein